MHKYEEGTLVDPTPSELKSKLSSQILLFQIERIEILLKFLMIMSDFISCWGPQVLLFASDLTSPEKQTDLMYDYFNTII